MAGGNERRVTVSNVKEYVNLAYDMRLKEFDAASTALRRGLVCVRLPPNVSVDSTCVYCR